MRKSGDDLFETLVGDGRPLIVLTALSLIASGGFALFLSAAQEFLPHDTAFLGMSPSQLCAINACRISYFMFHDRVSFGGVLISIGLLYLWLTEFPLKRGEAWAWWTILVSGLAGFCSFLAYLGYGYLDTWHGVASLFLLPCFVYGLSRKYRTLSEPRSAGNLVRWKRKGVETGIGRIGRLSLFVTSAGIIAGGLTILLVGMTEVFVPQDLEYIGLTRDEIQTLNVRLIPLIAHDRAGFGGALVSYGIAMFLCLRSAEMTRSLWQALALSGSIGFAGAIGIHPVIGYTNALHLLPAVAGAALFAFGLFLSFRIAFREKPDN